MKKFVYAFGGGTADGDGKMKEVLGGKGAGLAEMSRAGVPVPPGFTISTEVCNIFFENGNRVPDEINQQVLPALAKLEAQIGKKLGDPKNPLLVSVRSRARFSRSRDAVFRSWWNPKAAYYRKREKIPDEIGAGASVQAMVFGNLGDTSATGVGFTRDPATGEKVFYGEFLVNAQGEDVVAGIRTPQPIHDLEKIMPAAYQQLRQITTSLEQHYPAMQDFEFTIEDGTLYMLQTRNGKRTGPAALRIAVEMVSEGLLSKKEAILRVDPQQLDQLLHPVLDPQSKKELTLLAKGLHTSPGAS